MKSLAVRVCALALVGSVACSAERIEPGPRDVVGDAAMEAAVLEDTSVEEEAAVEEDATEPPDEGPAPDAMTGPSCRPNNDGVIERAEVPYVINATVLWAVNRDDTVVEGVRTAPEMTADGLRWDYSAALASDTRILDEVRPPGGQWWSSRYPGASFVLPLDRSNALFGVYKVTSTALQLLATVSREENRTELAMSPPVDVLRFPLREGDHWEQTVNAMGRVDYIANVNTTRYSFTVDARGTVFTPAGRFPVLRLRTELDQSIPLTVFRRTQRTYVFLSECWGLVARVGSVDNEAAMDFTRAAEFRRLGL